MNTERLVQPKFENCEGQRFHNLFWQPVSMIAHNLQWKYFAISIVEFILWQAQKFLKFLLLKHCLWSNVSDYFLHFFWFLKNLLKNSGHWTLLLEPPVEQILLNHWTASFLSASFFLPLCRLSCVCCVLWSLQLSYRSWVIVVQST